MESILARFYQANIYLMMFLGLWPYKVTTGSKIVRVVVSLFLVISTILQIAVFFTFKNNLNMLLENLATFSFMLVFSLKFHTFWINNDGVKILLDQVETDWHSLKNEEERQILEVHASLGRRRTTEYIILTVHSGLFTIMFPFLPYFLDIIVPLNVTRPRVLVSHVEYFIIEEDAHFYFAMMHQGVVIILGCIILLATETYTIIIMQHCSALFHITGYRLTNAFADCTKRLRATGKPPASFDSLVETVLLHRRSLQLVRTFGDTLSLSYMILVSVGIVALTSTLYRVSRASLSIDTLNELLTCWVFLIINLASIFFINFSMYQASEEGSKLFQHTYNIDWYNAPEEWKQMLLIIMLMCSDVPTFEMCSIYKPSMEGFAEIVKRSISYFMVIRSIQ